MAAGERWKKSHKDFNKKDDFYKLGRKEQTSLFRLRTGHNTLAKHMFKTFRIGESEMCKCGLSADTTEHILQECLLYKEIREKIWEPTAELNTKLFGPLIELEKTINFLELTGIHP
ncbi:hypothetical protein ElyMa_000581200 [Elysia marginata]|uniref:Reverse transcriptase zinc-binding domain-containing protein n=1 Tax=Elysia marginata TaxID=1093978 RepID=A0AAV4G621_9GAST|nr:hypothetical protein ElyMa_000581200 [Elysia marginata]